MRFLGLAAFLVCACRAQSPSITDWNSRLEVAATGRAADTPRVREMAAEALRLERATNDPGEAITLGILGHQLAGAGQYREARDTFQQSLDLAVERFGGDSVQAANARLGLAAALISLGDFEHARTCSQRAVDVFEARLGAKDHKVAGALTLLGSALMGLGNYPEAIASFERAVAIDEGLPGNPDAALGETLTRFAFALWSHGDFARARLTAERAIGILDTGRGATRGAGEAHRVMGDILVEMGDYSLARAEQDRSLQIFERWFGADSVAVGDTLVGMGNSAREGGDWQRARTVTERAVKIYEARLGPANSRVGGALDNLGQAFVLLKDWSGARACFERALAIQTKALGPANPWTANVYQGLAKVAAGTGDYAKAEELLRRNIQIWTEQLGLAHSFTATSRDLLAQVLARRGKRAEAIQTAVETADLRRQEIAYTVRTVDEGQALRFASRKTGATDTMLTLAASAPADPAAVWDELIRSRALVLDEMAARNRAARAAKDPSVARLIDAETRARAGLARLVVQGKGASTAAAWQQAVKAKRDEVYRTSEALAAASTVYRDSTARERAGLREVKEALPRGAALVAYARYEQRDLTDLDGRASPAYLAFVQRAGGGPVRLVTLGEATSIDVQVAALSAELARERSSEGHSRKRNEASYRAAAETLRRSIWDPIAPSLRGASEVYLVADGALQTVNFAALPAANGRYLAETGPLLRPMVAERDLVHGPPAPRGSGLLALGNPLFPSGPATDTAPTTCGFPRRFGPLPGSAREVEMLAAILKGKGWREEMLLGASATKSGLKAHTAGKRVVHLATHGFFLEGQCADTAALRDNPLLRSGLAMSAARAGGDAVLTAEEAAALDLTAAEWVVLSGCDTGLGDPRAGEGLLGLRRAFQEAGARAVIASLWQVDDRTTSEWMAALYRLHFLQGRGTAESVRDAERQSIAALRAQGLSTHPFYWAAFVAVER